MNPILVQQLDRFDSANISEERKAVLAPMISYISNQLVENNEIRLNFICTHNSRRSQISQVWAQALAWYYNLPIIAYSGGVEVTAFNPRAIDALSRIGFTIINRQESTNPTYLIFSNQGGLPIIGFSKQFNNPANSCASFAAIITCDHADTNCPYIPNASERIPVKYKDPKWSDDTDQELSAYDETVFEIGQELNYVMNTIKS